MGQGWLHVPRQHFFDRTFPPDLLLQLICPMRWPSSAANVPSSIFTDFTNMASEVSGMVTIKTMPIVDHKQHSTGAIDWPMTMKNSLVKLWQAKKFLVTFWHIDQDFGHTLTHWPSVGHILHKIAAPKLQWSHFVTARGRDHWRPLWVQPPSL